MPSDAVIQHEIVPGMMRHLGDMITASKPRKSNNGPDNIFHWQAFFSKSYSWGAVSLHHHCCEAPMLVMLVPLSPEVSCQNVGSVVGSILRAD